MNNSILTILIADSDLISAKNLEKELLKERFRVFIVDSSREIISQIRKREIDFAIIDVDLKDIEGYKIVPLIKDISKNIKVIITTSKSSVELEKKCRATGIIYYAIKPLDYDIIVGAIKYAIKKYK
jgi:DNA-binding NtrC family response regulator